MTGWRDHHPDRAAHRDGPRVEADLCVAPVAVDAG